MALTDALYQIDPNSMVLAVFFVITFALLMFILRRTGIGKNNATATVISLCISLLATYGITRTKFDLNGFVYNLGISEDTLYIIGPIAALFFIFLISRRKDPVTQRRKFSLGKFLMILGALIFALAFSGWIYQKGVFFVAGAVLLLIGLKLYFNRKRKERIGNMNWYEKDKFQKREARRLARWNRAGRGIGKGLAASAYGVGQAGKYAGKGAIAAGRGIGNAAAYTAKEIKKRQRAARIAKIREERLLKEEAERIRKIQQREIANKMMQQQKTQLVLPPAKQQLVLPPHEEKKQREYIKNEKLRQRSIQNLKSLYNDKYQEAIKQQNLAVKGVSGAKERYIQLQQELQRIVDKMNRI